MDYPDNNAIIEVLEIIGQVRLTTFQRSSIYQA